MPRVPTMPVYFLVVLVACLGLAGPSFAQTTRVSVAADGTQANGATGPAAAFSADGRFVVFASAASNLVASDTNASIDVFVKDRQTGAIVRVSVASDGTERPGDSGVEGVDISDNGMIVAFTSRAALSADDTNVCDVTTTSGSGPSCADIYVHDRASGQTARVSVDGTGAQANAASRQPGLSADGRWVVFESNATNLVAGDTNGASDIFLRDRVTPSTTRVSVTSAGAQADGASSGPLISDDGQVIAFISTAPALSDIPDAEACDGGVPCSKPFFHVRATGATTRISLNLSIESTVRVIMSADGRFVGALARKTSPYPNVRPWDFPRALYERTSNRGVPAGDALSGDGRFTLLQNTLFDRSSRRAEAVVIGDAAQMLSTPQLSGNGRFVLVVTSAALVAGDTNNAGDVFVIDRDTDQDGILDFWETLFGLDLGNPGDGALDPDADGRTNAQEYQANSHPRGVHTYYFAEGAVNVFFSTHFAIVNPGSDTATVLFSFLGDDARTEFDVIAPMPGQTQHTVSADIARVSPSFSTVVESDQPMVVSRRMHFGRFETASAAGWHEETAIGAPGTTWYLAEGATHGAFDLFYLLQNPGDTDAQVEIEYLRPAPLPSVVKAYDLRRRSRTTVWVDSEGPELEATDVSARITASQPVLVERSMYYTNAELPFIAGHAGAALPAPALEWFLAEGATGNFFDLYVLIANPGAADASVVVDYLLADGTRFSKPYSVAGRSRLTISVADEDPRLRHAAVATIVKSTNEQPVIVERAQWWPKGQWREAHLSAGSTSTGTRWGFAGAGFGSSPGAEADTYVLIANTSATDGAATLRAYIGITPVEIPVPLPANSRVTLSMKALFSQYESLFFGGVIDSGGLPIVVETASYMSILGRVWELGGAQLATRLQ